MSQDSSGWNWTINQPTPGANYAWVGQAGGDGHVQVDTNYLYDANGRPLSPAESEYWRNYDKQRATNAAITKANYQQAARQNQPQGGDDWVLDPIKGTYSVRKNGAWVDGITRDNFLSQLSDTTRKQHPDWWYGAQYDQSTQVDPWYNAQSKKFSYGGQEYDPTALYSHLNPYQQKMHTADYYTQLATQESQNYQYQQQRQLDNRVFNAQRSNPLSSIKYAQNMGM